jgi:zinc transport system substrate-binding protein
MIKNTKVKALFAEPQYSGSAAQTIANETGVKVYTLDPGVTGDAEEKDYDSYIRIMENNLEVLTQALS